MIHPTKTLTAFALLSVFAGVAAAAAEGELKPIFNGKDLAGWKVPDPNPWWTVKDGVLVGENDPGLKGNSLYTQKSYKDVEFATEFHFSGDIDSGVFLRKPLIQVQIGVSRSLRVDKTGSLYAEGRGDGYVGNATGVDKVLKPGDWNKLRFVARGDSLKVWLNDAQVLETSIAKYPDAAPLGLQIHAGVKMKIEFRNIRARELGDAAQARGGQPPNDFVAGKLIQLNDNGAWSWFMDPRAIVHQGKLVVGSVRAVKTFDAGKDDPEWGNVEIATLDLDSGRVGKTVLHRHFEQDDHDGPSFLSLPDGRLLAIYTRHGVERKVFYAHSKPGDPLHWDEPRVFETPGRESAAFRGDNATYSNPFRLPNGRIVNFFRGFDYDPNYMFSDDGGDTWRYGGRFLKGRDGYGPYMKYAYDGAGTVHFVSTEDHPRNFDNSLYHGMIRGDDVCGSDGKPVGKLSHNTDVQLHTWDVTRIFQGDADNVAWMCDLKLDRDKHPYVAFSVQKDGRGLPPRQGGMDHRYYQARYDGQKWHVHEMAHAGQRLYPGEDDYTGLATLDPRTPDTVYISTNADPKTGEPLISHADQKRHHELFRGRTTDAGATWTWEPITANSTTDNLRPLVPMWDDPRTALVWMRGSYHNNRGEWTTAVVAAILPADKR